VPIGVARVDRSGADLSVITYGVGVHLAREAAEACAASGIDVEILDMRTLLPLDREAIARTVAKTGKALVVHEANRTMGIGAEIAAFIAGELFEHLDAPVRRLASDDCHLPYNGVEEDAIILDARKVETAVRQLARY
jgi:2-oxoisovalerate dehydrogenase E1 component beta subunit